MCLLCGDLEGTRWKRILLFNLNQIGFLMKFLYFKFYMDLRAYFWFESLFYALRVPTGAEYTTSLSLLDIGVQLGYMVISTSSVIIT